MHGEGGEKGQKVPDSSVSVMCSQEASLQAVKGPAAEAWGWRERFLSHLENGGEGLQRGRWRGLLPQRPGWPALLHWELASSSSLFKIPTLSSLLPAPSLNLSPASILLP